MAKQEKSAAELYREERKQRIAKAAKKNSKKSHNVVMSKKTKAAIAVVLVLALVAGIGAVAINLSGVLERGKNVMTVGRTEVDKYEYSFYYMSNFNQYFNMSYQYDSYYGQGYGKMFTGYDCMTAPDAQEYTGEIEGIEKPTFADFFAYSAKQSIQYSEACRLYAEENGIELDEEDLQDVESQLDEYKEAAATQSDKKYSLAAYLRQTFGKGMTTKLFTKILTDQALNTKVSEVKTEELKKSYSDKEVEKIFNDNLDTYGVVTLRNYVIAAEKVKSEAKDGEEATEAVTKETLADAKKKAEAFKAALTDEASFKAAASDYEKANGNEKYEEILKDDTLTLLADVAQADIGESDEGFLKWAYDKNAVVGSTYMTEDETTGYTVYMMVEPVHHAPDAKTYDVRHILLQFPEEKATEGDAKKEVKAELLDTSKYDVTVDIDVDLEKTEDPALYMEAQEILEKYLDGDKTEAAFGDLAKEHSADGNADQGGIYEDVPVGQMVPEFESWALAEGREKGDVGIVETSYGYHIMYSVGVNTITWSDTIRTDKANEEYSVFAEEIIEGDNVKVEILDEAEIEDVEAFTLKMANNYIRNLQSQAAGTHTH